MIDHTGRNLYLILITYIIPNSLVDPIFMVWILLCVYNSVNGAAYTTMISAE
jgi:hypothetical protein